MRLLLGLIISFTSLRASGQTGEGKAFIRTLFGQSAAIAYDEKLWATHITSFEKVVAQDTLYDISLLSEGTKWLVLTQEERQYIQGELKRQANLVWTNDLFPNGKLITRSATGDNSNSHFAREANYGTEIHSFSDPIFIRKGAYCFFYHGYLCGTRCGGGEWVLYRKEKNAWVRWLVLTSWIS